jgi:release factor glutamine methyltransferase
LDHIYQVGPEVLVPRPETELLCVTAIQALKKNSCPLQLGLEIGVGSGILSIELLDRFPHLSMVASELNACAMERAHSNAIRILGPDIARSGRFSLVQAKTSHEVLEPLQRILFNRKADFLISNPPYLMEGDFIEAGVLNYEPRAALFAPPEDSLFFYRRIEEHADRVLKQNGMLFLEISNERAHSIERLFDAKKWEITVYPDLNGLERILVGKLKDIDG